ncbi:hypothetical protein BGX24_005384 [Mortierella sp. AD032]|nr:hypothetical protein BGX24_005384 [Mortierella sp. AD032]
MNFFTGIKKAIGTNALYYDEKDVNMIEVPLAGSLGTLPGACLPHVRDGHHQPIVAYKPLAWVCIVRDNSTIPYNHFETEYEKKSTTIETSDIYGHFEASFTLSIGGSWKAVKAELSTTTKVELNYKKSTEVKEEITQKGNIGDVVIKELILGMALRVERSHSSSLYLQALPVFNAECHLDNLHLVRSCKGWTDWYVYNGGIKIAYPIGAGRTETLPVPGKKPLVTFIAAVQTKTLPVPDKQPLETFITAGDRSGLEQ